MKELEDLNTFERAVLLACCKANNYSLGSHVPLGAITRKIRGVSHKYIKKVMKLLVSNGFVITHPTRRNVTYQMSKKGLEAGNILKKELENTI